MNESKNLKSQWMKLCKRSRSKSRQIWVIDRDRDRDRDQESWINRDRDRDRDEKCDLTGTGTGTGIAQNCQSRYRESRSITVCRIYQWNKSQITVPSKIQNQECCLYWANSNHFSKLKIITLINTCITCLGIMIELAQVGNILGISTLVGALVAQVPQILAIIKSKNVDGLSFNGFSIEIFS